MTINQPSSSLGEALQPRSPQQRIVITGVGVTSPVGGTAAQTWKALCTGQSGIGPITLFDASPYPIQFAGEVKDLETAIGAITEPKEARSMDRYVKLALVAAHEALIDSGMTINETNSHRVGVVIGSAAGGVATLTEQQQVLMERGARRVSPLFIANMLPDSATGHVAIATGARGVNMAVASACATGGHAIGEAAEMIRRGTADTMIAGGADAVIIPVILAGFVNMRALGSHPDSITRASRPFDQTRNGFVLSEAGAVVILESLEQAQRRGAQIYAEVAGYGASNDAHHMIAQSEHGEGAAQAMRVALQTAGLRPDQVDYINAHGTSTPQNDRTETEAIKTVFGEHAYRLAVSSTKSMTGHMMGASGALEAIVCALTIRDGVIAPTINYETPDPECDLDYVPNTARRTTVKVALSNSIGLGGHNSSLIMRATESSR